MKTETIKRIRKNNIECNLSVENKKFEIGLSGNDILTNEDILDYHFFNDSQELLFFLREIKFDRAINFYLFEFTEELIRVLYKNKLV